MCRCAEADSGTATSGTGGAEPGMCTSCISPLVAGEATVRLPRPDRAERVRVPSALLEGRRTSGEGRYLKSGGHQCPAPSATGWPKSMTSVGASPFLRFSLAALHHQNLRQHNIRAGARRDNTLDLLQRDMVGRSYPPFVVPAGWSGLTSTCRDNRARIEDSVPEGHQGAVALSYGGGQRSLPRPSFRLSRGQRRERV